VLYNEWKSGLDVVLTHDHKAGEKLFVDYAGMTVAITDSETGEISEAHVFIATLGASNYSACFLRSFSFQSIKSILQHQLGKDPLPQAPEVTTQNTQKLHDNLRGPSYYQLPSDKN
jgi:hypothetical protein